VQILLQIFTSAVMSDDDSLPPDNALRMDDIDLPMKLDNSQSASIPPLDGSNYASWKKAMRVLFMRNRLLDLLDSEVPANPDALWRRANGWAFSEIFFRVSPDIQCNLSDTMSAREAWLTLENLYLGSSLENVFMLSQDFNRLSQKTNQSAIQFINSVMAAATDLRHLGEDLSDQRIRFQILANLLPEYELLVTTLTHASGRSDLKHLKEAILGYEKKLAMRKPMPGPILSNPITLPSTSVAYASTATSTATSTEKPPYADRKCTECGKTGHLVDKCWFAHPELRPKYWKDPREKERNKHKVHKKGQKDKERQKDKDRRRQASDRRTSNKRKHDSPSSSSDSSDAPTKNTARMALGIPCTPQAHPTIDHVCMTLEKTGTGTGRSPTCQTWLLDSGASNHYTSDKSCFHTLKEIKPREVETASGHVWGTAIGDVILRLSCGTISIPDVMYVPGLNNNTYLISIGQLEDRGLEFHFKQRKCLIYKGGSLWAIGEKSNMVYWLYQLDDSRLQQQTISFPPIMDSAKPVLSSYNMKKKTDIQSPEIWHRRLGHVNKKYLIKLKSLSEGMEFGEPRKYKFDCEDCVKATQRRQISRFPTTPAQECLEVVYSDVCGPMHVPDFWGHKYFCSFLCAKSRFKWVYLMKKKEEVLSLFITWKAYVERRFNCKVRVYRTDGGGEYCSKHAEDYYKSEGIEHFTTQPYSSEMNGDAEVFMRIIVYTASSMLITANLRLDFWGQAVLCANYLLNRTPTKGLKLTMTPYEALLKTKPYFGHLRIWGCRVYAHISDKKRKKLDPHSRECLLMGYYDSENVFKLFDIDAKAMIKCRDAIFFEDILGHKDYTKGGLAVGKNILNEPLEENPDTVYEEIRPDDLSEQAMSVQFNALLSAYNNATTEDTVRLRALAVIAQPISILSEVPFDFKIPRSFKAAMKSDQKEHWHKACVDEMNALKWNKTWRVVPRPNDALVIQHK